MFQTTNQIKFRGRITSCSPYAICGLGLHGWATKDWNSLQAEVQDHRGDWPTIVVVGAIATKTCVDMLRKCDQTVWTYPLWDLSLMRNRGAFRSQQPPWHRFHTAYAMAAMVEQHLWEGHPSLIHVTGSRRKIQKWLQLFALIQPFHAESSCFSNCSFHISVMPKYSEKYIPKKSCKY